MHLRSDQVGAIHAAVWLIGMGVLFWTGAWWPGIMFLIGISAIVQGLTEGQGWYAFQGGLWAIGIGVWALFRFNIALFFVVVGLSVLLGAFVRPPAFEKKPRAEQHPLE